jgi:hypothetical protein
MTTMNKDRSRAQRPGATGEDQPQASDAMNDLYAAHQVHTLAHLVYRRLSEGWAQAVPPLARPMLHPVTPQAFAPGAVAMPGPGVMQPLPVPGQAIFYWYP